MSTDPSTIHNFRCPEEILNLRPTDKSKFIDQKNPAFRFKSNTSIDRVLETIDRNRSGVATELTQSRNPSFVKLRSRVNRTVDTGLVSPKNMYPELHQKTHFKAVYEMFVTPPNGNGV